MVEMTLPWFSVPPRLDGIADISNAIMLLVKIPPLIYIPYFGSQWLDNHGAHRRQLIIWYKIKENILRNFGQAYQIVQSVEILNWVWHENLHFSVCEVALRELCYHCCWCLRHKCCYLDYKIFNELFHN